MQQFQVNKPAAADVKATPVASAIIADKKVDSNQYPHQVASGKILKDDVLAALSNPGKKAFAGAELYSAEMYVMKK